MVINLITFASILHKQASVRSSHEVILTELEKYFTVNFIDYKDIDKLSPDDFSIIFIATGGVERLVIQHFESLPRPAILLADGMQNSLAAALEISSWLRGRGMKSEILHGELPETIKRIFVLHSNFVAQRSLFGMRIGVMGTPSSWLVASNVDYLLAKRRWGIEYTDVSLDRIYEYYGQITDDEVGEACAGLAGKALACREASPEDMIKAMRLYRAIKRIVEEERLSAITLSCFRLIDQTGTTTGPFCQSRTAKQIVCRNSEQRKCQYQKNPGSFICGTHIPAGDKQCKHNGCNFKQCIYHGTVYGRTVQQIDKPAELQYNNQSSKDKFTEEFI